MNAMEHGNQYQPDKDVQVLVEASAQDIVIKVRDQGAGSTIPAEVAMPNIDAKLAGEQSPRGWGLFLIKSLVDEMHTSSTDQGHTIELIMHR